jgi:cobalt/nickel transport system permease protein
MIKHKNFIEHSILGVLSFFKDSVFADEYASVSGFLQRRDARVKTVSFLFLLLSVLMAKSFFYIAAIYLFVLILASLSRINLFFFLERTWIFIPLFSLFIAIPALFNVFSPGEPIFAFNVFYAKFIVTRQGLQSVSLFVIRVVTCVSIAVLLTLTTKHSQLLKVLRIFKVPQIFVMTLGMCYRYIYLFAEIVEDTYRAIKSRVGSRIHHTKGREVVTWSIANLWQRSYHLNNQVYNAMLSRGYRGEPEAFDEFKTGMVDWLSLACVMLFFIVTRMVNL